MKDYIEQRVIELSKYIVAEKATVREAARVFKISKSTVHKDVTDRLEKINKTLFHKVRTVLAKNKNERHLRGGYATREKYKKQKEN